MENMKKSIQAYEDEILQFMEEEEETFKWIKEQEVEMKKEEETINAEIKGVEENIRKNEGEIEEKKKVRDGEAAKVDKTWYERYERIRNNKGGLALAQLITDDKGNGLCGGCKMSIRPQAVIEVRKKTTMHTCDSCARIWYVEDGVKADG